MPTGVNAEDVRLAELVATLSYAADLGLGQPLAHCMRKTVIALRMADLLGASDAEREATYYTGLMANVYCHADATEQASWFGDDISFKSGGFERLDMSTPQMIAIDPAPDGVPRTAVSARPTGGRLPTMRKRVTDFLTTHATLARSSPRRSVLDRRLRPRSGTRTSSGTARACRSTCAVTRSACRPG